MIDDIVLLIIAVAPSLTAIATAIGLCVSVLKKFKELREDIKTREDIEELKTRFKKILNENYELKALIKELLEKIDGIKRENEESEN